MTTPTDTKIAALHLWAALKDGQDGATVPLSRPNGHGTLPSTGYWVGGRSWTLTVSAHRIRPGMVRQFTEAHPRAPYIGYWIDQSTVHLDATDHIPDLVTALALAEQRGETAIWDITHQMEIRLD